MARYTRNSVWNEERDGFLREVVPGRSLKEVKALFNERFGVDLTDSQLKNRKLALGLKSGTVGGRFEKGHAPWTKGRNQSEWIDPALAERTQFNSGNVPHNHKPMGHETVRSDGYVYVKVRDDAHQNNFVQKHRLVWEQHNGPIPKGHRVLFADGDKTNCDISNLRMVSDAQACLLNNMGLRYHDGPTLDAALAAVQLDNAIIDAGNRPRKCEVCGSEFKPSRHDRNSNRVRTCPTCVQSRMRARRMSRCEPKVCPECGAEYIPYNSKQKRCHECIHRKERR